MNNTSHRAANLLISDGLLPHKTRPNNISHSVTLMRDAYVSKSTTYRDRPYERRRTSSARWEATQYWMSSLLLLLLHTKMLCLNSTQLNSTQIQIGRSSRSLKKQSVVLLNNSTALQLTTHAGKLFHASIRPYSNCKIKYFLASTQTCGLKSLSSWPLSPVNDVLKKSVCLMSSKPLKIKKKSLSRLVR